MILTADQNIQFSEKIGGARVVFEGHNLNSVGGYNFNIADLPIYPNVLPAGTPIKVDDVQRTVVGIHYAFEVYEAASSATSLKIKKGPEGSRIKVGMFIMAAPAAATTKGTGIEVTAVETSNPAYDVITVAETTAAAGAIFVEADKSGSGASMKVVPNGLTDRDKRIVPGSTAVNTDCVWGSNRAVLTNRIPPIAPCVKTALLENGCYFRWSARK